MRVVSFSTDWNVFHEDSTVARRQRMQAATLERLEVFVPHGPKQIMHLAPNATMRGFGLGKILGALRAILATLRLPQPDVVTAQDPFLIGLTAWVAARLCGAKLHIQVHTAVFDEKFAAHSKKNKVYVWLARFVLRRADAVRVVSEKIKHSLEQLHLAVPVSVLPVFVDGEAIERAQPLDRNNEFPDFKKIILVVSRLEPEKNVADAIRILSEVVKAQPGVGLVIVGDGRESAALRSLAEELGVAKYVAFVGSRNPYPFYKAADVALVTSHFEGYGMVIVEALAAGCPVVSYDVGVAREAGAILATRDDLATRVIAVLSEGRKATLSFALPSEIEYRDMWYAEIGGARAERGSITPSEETAKPRIGFVGQGFIGKNYADDMERRGYDVTRYALEEPYRANKEKIKECDIVFIAVPTPTTPEKFDDSIVKSALALVGKGKTAVVKSTLLPGTTEKLQKEYPDIFVMHSPEFLREATAAYDASHPDRNIVGIVADTPEAQVKARAVLSVLPKAPFELVCTAIEAEFVKYAGNSWLYVKVVYVNMLYDLVQKLGANWEVVRDALAADPRVGRSHLDPVHQSGHGGPAARGAGGHCLIKDFEALRRLYEEKLHDQYGAGVFDTLAAKNLDLLLQSEKDIDLVKGVYGEDPEKAKQDLLK
ncbi:glycosyltransferase [Candidatus Parcubacteria bacterium]|nr:MAG: glycosyltransferase [Candidatus Parcubacteria bacterium]